jgi:hypothetical protein
MRIRLRLIVAMLLIQLTAVHAHAQADTGRTVTSAQLPSRAPYLLRGDEVEKAYDVYRGQLERFFDALSGQVNQQAPELRPRLVAPAPVAFGYQILPALTPTPAPRARSGGIILSPFSWNRTDSMITRGRDQLATLDSRLEKTAALATDERRREYGLIVDAYLKLVSGQKLMESTIQYNRLWQGDIARRPQIYADARILQGLALERQRVLDSISRVGEHATAELHARVEVLTLRINEAIEKLPAPDFVRADHPDGHRWTLSVPLYTDIVDFAFIDSARAAIEDAWHVSDGADDYSVVLEIHSVSPSQLYPDGNVPAKGAHVDVADHVRRFPSGGAVLTTGGNSIYALGRSIILGPHTIPRSALAHEFGHVLGFKDGYFRSYRDRGVDGYEVLEVILDPESVVAAPENGRVRREYFDQLLHEKLR